MWITDSVTRCRRSVAAFAWGDDIVFSPASIAATKEEAKDFQLVTVNVGKEISKGYTKGGQFLQMKVGDSKPAFLAIANAPAASEDGFMEFLIKDVPETTASMIVKLCEGDEVRAASLPAREVPHTLLNDLVHIILCVCVSTVFNCVCLLPLTSFLFACEQPGATG